MASTLWAKVQRGKRGLSLGAEVGFSSRPPASGRTSSAMSAAPSRAPAQLLETPAASAAPTPASPPPPAPVPAPAASSSSSSSAAASAASIARQHVARLQMEALAVAVRARRAAPFRAEPLRHAHHHVAAR